MGFKIEKGIPMPRRGRPCGSKYPFDQMEIGDSFVIPDEKVKSVRAIVVSRRKTRKDPHCYVVGRYQNSYRCWRST
jgi:hypothetical protein